jgi:hypothetical protein
VRALRWAVLVVSLGLGACEGVLEPRIAATAAGQVLTVEHLARWIAAVKHRGVRSTHFEAIAAVYVDDMLFADAAARRRNWDDSALVLEASWPTVAALRWTKLRDALARARGPLTPAEVDSAYGDGRVRLLQHVLLRLSADAPPATVAKTEARAEALRRAILAEHGASFAAMARRYSEDPSSRAGGGYLSPGTREEFLGPFNNVAWSLAPGEISAVVRSPFGVHVIRRPPLAEVRAAYAAGLERLYRAHEDSVRLEQLAATKHLVIEPDAPGRVRRMFANMLAARADSRWVARFDGGGFAVKDVARWLSAMNPGQVALLPSAADVQIRQFLEVVAERELVLAEADSAGIGLSPFEWQAIRARHDSAIQELEDVLGVSHGMLGDSAPARRALAAAHTLAYLDRMFANEVAFAVVPPLLASVLRDSATWSISRRGVAAAAARADELLAAGPPPRPGSPLPGQRSVP